MIKVSIPEWGVSLIEMDDNHPLWIIVAIETLDSDDTRLLVGIAQGDNEEIVTQEALKAAGDANITAIIACKLSSVLSRAAMLDEINMMDLDAKLDKQ